MHRKQDEDELEGDALDLAALLTLLGRAEAFLRPAERALTGQARVRGIWYEHLPLAAKEGAALLEAQGAAFLGLGFGARELRQEPVRLQALLCARAAVGELQERIDRAIASYKERIARRTFALRRSLLHKLRDEGLPAPTRAALRDAALPFERLFEAHNQLAGARRRSTRRLRAERAAVSKDGAGSSAPPPRADGGARVLAADRRPALPAAAPAATDKEREHEAKESDQDPGGGGLRHPDRGADGAGAHGGGA